MTSYETVPVPPPLCRETPAIDDRNAFSLVGIHLECRECGRKWIGMFGGWRIEPGGRVYCDACSIAEANE